MQLPLTPFKEIGELGSDLEFAQVCSEERVSSRLLEAGLKVNVSKSSFCKSELEHSVFQMTRQDIQPLTKKVKAILKISQTNKQKSSEVLPENDELPQSHVAKKIRHRGTTDSTLFFKFQIQLDRIT